MNSYISNNFDLNSDKLISIIDELPLWSAPFGLTLLDYVRLKKNINALDIGCGTGFLVLEMAQRLGITSKVYGLDPWKTALDRARQKLDIISLDNVEFIEGIAEEMPFEDNFFDLITSNNGLNNIDNQERALSECYRTARKGCQLLITQNLPDTMYEFYDIFTRVLADTVHEELISKVKQHISKKRKTISETVDLIEKAGFNAINIIKKEFYYRFIDGTSFLNYFFIRLAFLDSWMKIVPVEEGKIVFETVEKRLNEAADKNGELKLTIPYVCIECHKK